ncbi:MAG: hypothetical protein QM705_10335 [Ancrocorticia sp.]
MNNTIASPAFVSAPAQVEFVSVKRIADVVISLIVLVALALPAAVIALILKAGAGKVVDVQLVAGAQGGFVKYSFHTGGAFGSFLATSGLAIIPTFINVLRGEMNLVELAPATDGTSDARVIAKALVAAFTK